MNIKDIGHGNIVDLPDGWRAPGSVVRFRGGFGKGMPTRNSVQIGEDCEMQGVTIDVFGQENCVILGRGTRMPWGASLLLSGTHLKLMICDGFYTGDKLRIVVEGTNNSVAIGENCKFSQDILVRCGDGHQIVDLTTEEILNTPKDIVIERHVWVGARAIILKGVHIRQDSVVGAGAVVTRKKFLPNSVIAGNPAEVVRSGITWK